MKIRLFYDLDSAALKQKKAEVDKKSTLPPLLIDFSGGESRTWYETYDAPTERWEQASSTLAEESAAFEAGNQIVIEEDAEDGLQIRIETRVTRELHF